MSEYIDRDMQPSRALQAVPIPLGHPANALCVFGRRIKTRNVLFTIVIGFLYADPDPACPDRWVMILQAQARMAKICHLFQDLEPRDIFLIPADLVQGRALHIERGLGWFSNGGHIDLRIEGYLDTLGIIVTL